MIVSSLAICCQLFPSSFRLSPSTPSTCCSVSAACSFHRSQGPILPRQLFAVHFQLTPVKPFPDLPLQVKLVTGLLSVHNLYRLLKICCRKRTFYFLKHMGKYHIAISKEGTVKKAECLRTDAVVLSTWDLDCKWSNHPFQKISAPLFWRNDVVETPVFFAIYAKSTITATMGSITEMTHYLRNSGSWWWTGCLARFSGVELDTMYFNWTESHILTIYSQELINNFILPIFWIMY